VRVHRVQGVGPIVILPLECRSSAAWSHRHPTSWSTAIAWRSSYLRWSTSCAKFLRRSLPPPQSSSVVTCAIVAASS
jgi:hypothetical protein